MIKLLHSKISGLENILKESADINKYLMHNHVELDVQLMKLIGKCYEAFKEDSVVISSKAKVLQAEWALCCKGTDPLTLIKPSNNKREMQTSHAVRILRETVLLLSNEHEKCTNKIETVTEIMGQIVLVALQNIIITDDDVANASTQDKLEDAWKKIGTENNLKIMQKKILLSVGIFDAYIVLDKTFAAIR
jgi:hypothetical protein